MEIFVILSTTEEPSLLSIEECSLLSISVCQVVNIIKLFQSSDIIFKDYKCLIFLFEGVTYGMQCTMEWIIL